MSDPSRTSRTAFRPRERGTMLRAYVDLPKEVAERVEEVVQEERRRTMDPTISTAAILRRLVIAGLSVPR